MTGRVLRLLCAAMLAGCGGGGGGDAGAPGGGSGGGDMLPSAVYFPLAEGNRWLWRNQSGAQGLMRVLAQQPVEGQAAWPVASEDDAGVVLRYLVAGSAALRVLPDAFDPVARAIGPYDLLRFPMRAGDRFTSVDRSFTMDVDGDGRGDTVTVRGDVTIVGSETLTTPLGVLPGTLHITTRTRTTVTLAGNQGSGEANVVEDEWFAPDIGPVRTDTAVTINGLPSESDSRVVVGYQVDGRRSDSQVPQVRSLHPADQGRRGSPLALRVTFDELMDSFSLRQSNLRAVRDDGWSVPGRLEWTAQTLSFVPTSPLPPGRYTMQAGAPWRDAAGNPVATPAWSFEIANDAWQAAAMSPGPDAVDVALASTLRLTFDDEPDPDTVANNIALTSALGTGPVAVTVQTIGRVVTLVPAAPLERTRMYQVNVNAGLRDRHGNQLVAQHAYRFTADGGAFATAQSLYQTNDRGHRNAVADMNGDGRSDLVTLTMLPGSFTPELYVLHQRVDGTLAPPQLIPRTLAPRNGSACYVIDFVLQDLNADGRPDIALAAQSCGLEVLLQAADGSLQSSHFLDLPTIQRVHATELNGDGVPDLAASSYYGVTLWHGHGDATPTPAGTVGLSAGILQAALADLDGDGRGDVIALLEGTPSRAAWRLQQSDGSFGAQQESIVFAEYATPGALAVGDVTGDGRADILAVRGGNSPTPLALLRQQAGGSFAGVETQPTYDLPSALLLADLNADGVLDIVVAHSGWLRLGVYFSNGSGTPAGELLYPVEYQTFEPGSLAAGDLDGDGLPDLVVGKEWLRGKLPAVAAAFGPAERAQAAAIGRPTARPVSALQAIVRSLDTQRR